MAALPIVDISSFIFPTSSEDEKQKTAKALFDACHDFGFFYLVGHGIPKDTMNEVLKAAKDWFLTATDEEKAAVQRTDAGGKDGGDGVRGYQKIGENVTQGKSDFHEAIDLYRPFPNSPANPPYETLQGPNLYPTHPTSFKPLIESYITLLLDLGAIVMRCMALSLNLPPDYFDSYVSHPFWVTRIIGYPPLSAAAANDGGVSCGEHTDYGCWTFLLTDETRGALKVLGKDGKTWVDADPIEGAYVVNIGDMMERWTNGLWKSTLHKVIHTGSNYRVSLPVFYEPNYDAKIEPLDVCVRMSGGERKFDAKVYGEHLMEKVTTNFYVAPKN